jgi:hypothetical protein
MAKAKVKKEEEVVIKSDPVLNNVATFVVELFIKEDVNAFAEADLLHDLLVYKLDTGARPIMEKTVRTMGDELKLSRTLDLKKRIGGLTQQKRVLFRTEGQYNSMITLFFQVVEEKPELVGFLDDESSFENFMILCINDFREVWERFVTGIVEERMVMERKKKLYANRNRADEGWENVPTYADYVAERVDELAAPANA